MTWLADLVRVLGRPLQWWVVVATWEQGVLVRWGRTAKLLQPGIHFRIPYLDRVVVTCTRERATDTSCRTSSTRDGYALTVGLAVFYSVVNAKDLIESVARPEETLRALALCYAAAGIAAKDKNELKPEQLAQEVSVAVFLATQGWGLGSGRHVKVSTFTYARAIRLLQGHDSSYSSIVDDALDAKPAEVS